MRIINLMPTFNLSLTLAEILACASNLIASNFLGLSD
jgi:hypothetical protein